MVTVEWPEPSSDSFIAGGFRISADIKYCCKKKEGNKKITLRKIKILSVANVVKV